MCDLAEPTSSPPCGIPITFISSRRPCRPHNWRGGNLEKRYLIVVRFFPSTTLTMEPGEALGITAQIGVALAGFAGVVVVFRRESVHEWSTVDKLRLRLLLGNSILPLGLCMLGMLLLTIKPMPAGIWRWCSGIAFVVSLLFAVTMTKYFRRLDVRQIDRKSTRL